MVDIFSSSRAGFTSLREQSNSCPDHGAIGCSDSKSPLACTSGFCVKHVYRDLFSESIMTEHCQGRVMFVDHLLEEIPINFPRFGNMEIVPVLIFARCERIVQEFYFSCIALSGNVVSHPPLIGGTDLRLLFIQKSGDFFREIIIHRHWVNAFELGVKYYTVEDYHLDDGYKTSIYAGCHGSESEPLTLGTDSPDVTFSFQSGIPPRPLCPTSGSSRTPDRKPVPLSPSPKALAAKRLGIEPTELDKRKKAKTLDKTRRRDAKSRKEMAAFQFQGFGDLLKGTFNLHPDVTDAIDDFRDHAEKISDQVPKMAELLSKLEGDGLQIKHGLDKSFLHVPAIAALFSLTYMASVHKGRWVHAAGAFGAVYAGTCVYQHRSFLLERITKIFSREQTEFKAQSFDISMVEDLSAAIIGYMSLLSCKNMKDKSSQVAAFVKSLGHFDRSKNGLSAAITFGIGMVTRIINWFREEFLGLGAISLIASSIPELEAWTKKVNMVHDEGHAGTLAINTQNAARLHALVSEGANLLTKKFSTSDCRQVSMAVGVYMGILRKLIVPFDSANLTSDGCRMEPVIILFTGKPGVGKTWAMMPVLLEVMKRIVSPEQREAFLNNYRDFIFCRFPETKYWEGYRRQLACLFDDFGQARDAAGQPDNEYLELIRAGNIFPYLLHMAGIDAKANTTFQSRLIFCTSNQKNFSPQSIVEKEAVMRRFNMIIDVAPKAEYCVDPEVQFSDRRLNKDHPVIKAGSFSPDIYEFQLKEQVSGIVQDNPIAILTYQELIDRIVRLYETSSARADDYLSYLDDLVKGLASGDKFRSQSAHSVDLTELHELEHQFDSAHVSSKSKMNLDDLLGLKVETSETMNRDQFHLWINKNLGVDWLKKLRNAKRPSELHSLVHAFCAYRINSTAFMECFEKHPNRLLDLIDVLVDDNVSYVVVDNDSILERKAAESTLMDYFGMIKRTMADPLGSFNQLAEWQQWAVTFTGMWSIMRVTGVHAWIDGLFRSSKDMETKDVVVVDSIYETDPSDLFMESGGPRERNVKFVVNRPKAKTTFTAEGGKDLNACEIMKSAVRHSQYYMTIPSRGFKVGYINFISGRHALCPNHFITMLKVLMVEGDGDIKISLWNCISKIRFVTTIRSFIEGHVQGTDLASGDLALVHLPVAHTHRDNTGLFVRETQIAGHKVLPGILSSLNNEEEIPGISTYYAPFQKCEPQGVEIHGKVVTINNLIRYNAPTEEGDCGMLALVNLSGFGPGKVAGIHVAGAGNMVGIGAIVTYERLTRALTHSEHKVLPVPVDSPHFMPQCGEMPFPGSFEKIGLAEKYISQPMRSSIIRSELHDLWTTSPKAPACLRTKVVDGVIVDPKIVAVCRYGNTKPYVDITPLKLAADFLSSRALMFTEGHYNEKPFVLNFEEAVLGNPSRKYCNSVPRKTSAGFPHVMNPRPGFRGKEMFFGKEDEYDLTRPECVALREECDEIIASAKEGKRSSVVYIDVLKDELRKKERVRTANTRLISAAPIAYTIVCRMYFLAWVMAVMANNLLIGIGVGINCYSSDWHVLATGLCSISEGRNCLAGDFTGYDTSHCRQLAELVLGIIQNWYNQREDDVVREVLFADLTSSVHVIGDLIYLWASGNLPSGHPLTAIFSSFITLILYIAAWIELNPKGVAGLPDFYKHVYIVTYGDDSIVSVSDWAIKFFNYHTISAVMKKFGYTYTDEMKTTTGEGPISRPLSEVNFLKRGFRYEEAVGRYVAPLAIESILEMLYWTKRGANQYKITCENVDHALRELSLHSRQDFQLWAPRVVEAAREFLEHHPGTTDYRALQAMTCCLDNIW